jgi:hypothetical protein
MYVLSLMLLMGSVSWPSLRRRIIFRALKAQRKPTACAQSLRAFRAARAGPSWRTTIMRNVEIRMTYRLFQMRVVRDMLASSLGTRRMFSLSDAI